jgi:hypothetical protein
MSVIDIQAGRLKLGYKKESENHAWLKATAKPFNLVRSMRAPRIINHRKWLKIVSQGQMGSCTGHAMKYIMQVLHWIATGGDTISISALFAYIEAQRASGFLGQDQGASIAGAVQAGQTVGGCTDDVCPYPNPVVYTTRIPQPAYENAKHRKVHSQSIMRSYSDCLNWLATGVGCLDFGIDWTYGLANNKTGIADRSNSGGQSLGGHSVAGVGLNEKVDQQGRPYIDVPNSHGDWYGDKGWIAVEPALVDQQIQSGATVIGVSHLDVYGEQDLPLHKMGCD